MLLGSVGAHTPPHDLPPVRGPGALYSPSGSNPLSEIYLPAPSSITQSGVLDPFQCFVTSFGLSRGMAFAITHPFVVFRLMYASCKLNFCSHIFLSRQHGLCCHYVSAIN